jgi:DNA (cytosine-5)-methyltransferase 1
MRLTFGSLFAGIGGFDLGFERAGMVCKWQVEIDPFCRRVLAKHWPDVRRHDDVRTFPHGDPEAWKVDVICGGFPCQDISLAGKGAGIAEGTRSGLWADYVRIVRLLRPRYVVVENVSALLIRGMGRVLGDLAESGFDVAWDCLPACSFGAPHRRDRVFLVAHAAEVRRGSVSDELRNDGLFAAARKRGMQQPHRNAWWDAEPGVRRVDDGIPTELDCARLGSLGNAVVPQVAEWIGRRLISVANSNPK